MTDLEREIRELEEEGWRALSGPGRGEFYARIMAEDGLMLFPGVVMDKKAALAAIAGASPWAEHELTDVQIRELGPSAALIAYRAAARRAGAAPYRALMSSVYVRRGDRWLLVLHQQSPE